MRARPKLNKNVKNGCPLVAGLNSINQISEKSNNVNQNNMPIVCPPEESSILPGCLSYSIYFDHSVMTDGNSAYSKGPNTGNTINKSQLKKISKFNKLTISDKENKNYSIVSAVCGSCYTLYLLNSNQSDSTALAYFDQSLKENDGAPIFLDIKGRIPLALFGGRITAAAIDDQGCVFVISQSVLSTSEHSVEIISLPNNEKATYVACLEDTLFILSNNHKVYKYSLTDQEIEEVEELANEQIISLSGTWKHVLAVTNDFRVFGRGENKYGQLCHDPIKEELFEFENLYTLNKKNIVSAYAGCYHSLFIDSNGRVLSCGRNNNGELLLQNNDIDIISKPTETLIQKGAKFCIAGCQISCVFCSIDPPQNTPNQQIKDFNINISQKLILKPNSISNDSELPEPNPSDDTASIKSRLLKMKEELEAKNRFYDIIQSQNQNIIKRLQDLDQKIDQFVKSNKFEDNVSASKTDEENVNLVDEPPKGASTQKGKITKNKTLTKKAGKEYDNDDDDEPKRTKPKKNKPTNNKNAPIKKKPIAINSDSENDDDDNSDDEEKNRPRNKQIFNKKPIKQQNNIEEYDDMDDDEDKNTKINTQLIKSNKKTKKPVNIRNDNNDNSEEEEETKIAKNKQKPNKKLIRQQITTNDDSDDDDDDDEHNRIIRFKPQLLNANKNSKPQANKSDDDNNDVDFQPAKRSNTKKTNPSNKKASTIKKKSSFSTNKEYDDDEENFEIQKPRKGQKEKKVTFPKNKISPIKKKPSDDDSDDGEIFEHPNRNYTKKQNKRQNINDDDDDENDNTMINYQLLNANKNSKPQNITNDYDEDDSDDVGFQPPKRSNTKKTNNTNKKASPIKKKTPINNNKEYDDDYDFENEQKPKAKFAKSAASNVKTYIKKGSNMTNTKDDDDDDDDFNNDNAKKPTKINLINNNNNAPKKKKKNAP